QSVDVKLVKASREAGTLQHEYEVLQQLGGVNGVPRAHWFGPEYPYDALVLDPLGPTLEDVFAASGRKLSLGTIVDIARRLITCLEDVHLHQYLHRNISPSSIFLGDQQSGNIYLSEFMLAHRFRDTFMHRHLSIPSSETLTYSADFASIDCHLGAPVGRCDDLESLAYVFLYLSTGSLPWRHPNQTNDVILHGKQATLANMNDSLQSSPTEFLNILSYARSLSFTDKPDYPYIHSLLHDLDSRLTSEETAPFN
ncbi:kinase-like protein, partial [Coniophora puteana RWD-64-598 SS2]